MPTYTIHFTRDVHKVAEHEAEAADFIEANRIADDLLRLDQVDWQPDGQDENFDVEEMDPEDPED